MEDPLSGDLDDGEVTMDGGSGIVADIVTGVAGRPKLITHDQGRPSSLPARVPTNHDGGNEVTIMGNDGLTSGTTSRADLAVDSRLPRPRPIPHSPDPKPSMRTARLNEIRSRIEVHGTDPGSPDEPDPQNLPAPPAAGLIAGTPKRPAILKLEDMVLPVPPHDLRALNEQPIERDRILTSSRLSSSRANATIQAAELRSERRSPRVLVWLAALLLVLLVAAAMGYSRGIGV